MSTSAPLRRIAPRCLYLRPTSVSSLVHHQQRRTAASDHTDGKAKQARVAVDEPATKQPAEDYNPTLDEWRRNHPQGIQSQQQTQAQQRPDAGDIAPSSIFEDERRLHVNRAKAETPERKDKRTRDPENSRIIFDPNPNARERWERKKVIQSIRKRGKLSREEVIKQTERESLQKSGLFKTSVKKLMMLARQIAGKRIDDAMVQMRFSKKKIASRVLSHLHLAKNVAIVRNGMGLGSVGAKGEAASPEATTQDIQLKDGKRHTVTDPSKIYIEQAWVGRGPYGKMPEFRAKGRVNILRTPFTSLTVKLKEEKTLVREHQDREAKRLKKRAQKVWVHLPDRPVTGPRGQFYSW